MQTAKLVPFNRTDKRQAGIALGSAILAMVLTVAAVDARAQTYTVLYNFGVVSTDPCNPENSGVIAQGRLGDLHSTAGFCATNNDGDVFKITPEGVFTDLHDFDGTDGATPTGGVTLGTDNYFYGTTSSTIFRMTPSGSLSTLYNFEGGDGCCSDAPPIQGTDGNFYGTTSAGGAHGEGTVYKLTPAGTFTVLHSFGKNAESPMAPVVEGPDGDYYGTVPFGGGLIFKVSPSGKFTQLHTFNGTDGGEPFGALVLGNDGNFYGIANYGGTNNGGVIFKITPSGAFNVLYNLNGTTDGNGSFAGLMQGSDGNFYGAALAGGDLSCSVFGEQGCGTIFRITPQGVFSALHDFDGTTGKGPESTPFQHTNGIIYGMTMDGGSGQACPTENNGCGVFYSFDIGLPPFVTFLPAQRAAKVGKPIEIFGQGFTTATNVSFNGTAANFKVVSDTYLTATVPQGAKSGFVTVTTSNGTLTSNIPFRVLK